MKNTIKISSILLALAIAVAVTACSDKQDTAPGTPDHMDEQNNPSTQPGNAEQVPSVKEGTGTYTGQADPHTVEIVVDGKPTAFQLGDGLDQTVADLQEQDHVQFKYEEKAIEGEDTLKQLVLTELKKRTACKEQAKAPIATHPARIHLPVLRPAANLIQETLNHPQTAVM